MGHYKLRLGVGKHYEPTKDANGVETLRPVGEGEVIECDRDLAAVYPEKFEAVTAPATVAPAAETPAAPANKKQRGKAAPAPTPAPAPANVVPTPPAPASADDVTAEFPLAVTANLIVRGSDANGFNFYERDIPTEAINPVPLNREGLVAELTSYVA